jgi:hypothetical protein
VTASGVAYWVDALTGVLPIDPESGVGWVSAPSGDRARLTDPRLATMLRT